MKFSWELQALTQLQALTIVPTEKTTDISLCKRIPISGYSWVFVGIVVLISPLKVPLGLDDRVR